MGPAIDTDLAERLRDELGTWRAVASVMTRPNGRGRYHALSIANAVRAARKAAKVVDVKAVFQANCGDAEYKGHEFRERDGFKTLAVGFDVIPEGRHFDIDTVIHGEGSSEEQMQRAVLRVADIARNVRQHMKPE